MRQNESEAELALKKGNAAGNKFIPRRRGTPDAIRTHDLQSRSLTLYPAELQARMSSAIFSIAQKNACEKGKKQSFLA